MLSLFRKTSSRKILRACEPQTWRRLRSPILKLSNVSREGVRQGSRTTLGVKIAFRSRSKSESFVLSLAKIVLPSFYTLSFNIWGDETVWQCIEVTYDWSFMSWLTIIITMETRPKFPLTFVNTNQIQAWIARNFLNFCSFCHFFLLKRVFSCWNSVFRYAGRLSLKWCSS